MAGTGGFYPNTDQAAITIVGYGPRNDNDEVIGSCEIRNCSIFAAPMSGPISNGTFRIAAIAVRRLFDIRAVSNE
jgi:hypothetical protein